MPCSLLYNVKCSHCIIIIILMFFCGMLTIAILPQSTYAPALVDNATFYRCCILPNACHSRIMSRSVLMVHLAFPLYYLFILLFRVV